MGILGTHFTLWEFRQKARYGCPMDPYPLARVTKHLLPLLCGVLEPIRREIGRPVIITSAWRTPLYNRRCGGVPKSRHKHGDATDFQVPGLTAYEVHDIVLSMWRAGRLPELGALGRYRNFTHVDARPHRPGELVRWG